MKERMRYWLCKTFELVKKETARETEDVLREEIVRWRQRHDDMARGRIKTINEEYYGTGRKIAVYFSPDDVREPKEREYLIQVLVRSIMKQAGWTF